MRRWTLVLAVSIGGSMMGTSANAAQDAYCLKKSAGPGDCKYSTYQQCSAALSGTNGTCRKNPDVAGSAPGGWIPHGPNERPISEQSTTGKSR